MKILYINHYAGGPSYGMEYRCYYLAREWVRAGHDVTIVGASYSHVRQHQPAIHNDFTEEQIEGIRYIWCATNEYRGNGFGRVRSIFKFLWRLRSYAKWVDSKPDAVIASSTYPLDIYIAREIASNYGATLVWEVHDLWPLSPIELGGMSRWHPFIMLLQRAEDFACRCSDLVISMLPLAQAHLLKHGMAPEKFVYVPNGVDLDEWADADCGPLPPQHAAVLAEARRSGDLTVAYAGAHGVANALGSILDAAKILRNEPIRFLLIGNGPEKEALKMRVQREDIRNVSILDPVAKSAIPTLLRAVDVLFIGLQRQPLFRFGISPNKLMDYMMASRPVICAIDAGNDLVTDAQCGITIEPESPISLADAVRKFIRMTADERDRLGANGRTFVMRSHSYSVLGNNFLRAIQDRQRFT